MVRPMHHNHARRARQVESWERRSAERTGPALQGHWRGERKARSHVRNTRTTPRSAKTGATKTTTTEPKRTPPPGLRTPGEPGASGQWRFATDDPPTTKPTKETTDRPLIRLWLTERGRNLESKLRQFRRPETTAGPSPPVRGNRVHLSAALSPEPVRGMTTSSPGRMAPWAMRSGRAATARAAVGSTYNPSSRASAA